MRDSPRAQNTQMMQDDPLLFFYLSIAACDLFCQSWLQQHFNDACLVESCVALCHSCTTCHFSLSLSLNLSVFSLSLLFLYLSIAACDPSCQSCFHTPTQEVCLSCSEGYPLLDTSCVTHCPSGFKEEAVAFMAADGTTYTKQQCVHGEQTCTGFTRTKHEYCFCVFFTSVHVILFYCFGACWSFVTHTHCFLFPTSWPLSFTVDLNNRSHAA